MTRLIKTLALLAAAGTSVPLMAHADEYGAPSKYSYSWEKESHLSTGYGVSTSLGGGIIGFTDRTMRDSLRSDIGGLWNLNVTLGTHVPLGLSLGYLGSAVGIDTLLGTGNRTLVGTTLEAALRYNVLPHFAWNPYVFAGIGWQRFDVTGEGFALSDAGMKQSDNATVFPMGAGMAFRDRSGFVVDVHGTFRASANGELVLENPLTNRSTFAPMHSWEAAASIGYEF